MRRQRCDRLAFASEVPGSEVWAVEKSATTAEWTRRNFDETAKRYSAIAGNYHLDIADATQMPTLSQLDGTIDIVLTNPPYVPLADIPEQPEVRDYDPIWRYTVVRRMARSFRNASSHARRNCFVRVDLW